MTKTDVDYSEYSILYLEDEILIAIDVTHCLSDLKFRQVKTVHRLDAAQRAVVSENFDVALLDINVDRKQTSIELGENLKARGVRVIFASGNSADCQRMRDRGFEFLDKPFSHDALVTKLAQALQEAA